VLQSFQKAANLDDMKHPWFYVSPWLSALFFTVVFTLSSPLARAASYGELGAHLTTERSEDGGAAPSASSERHFRFDIATGLRSEVAENQAVTYGVVFKSERGFQTGGELSGYGLGAFVGWSLAAFSARLDYLIFAELKSNSGVSETQFREGAGFNLELRWLVTPQSEPRLSIGPALAFTQMTFAKMRIGSLPETSASRKTESLTPGIRAAFVF
jgi:hypothetical protein